MSTQGRGMSTLGHHAWGVLCLLVAACAGGDTPARDRTFEDNLCKAYPEECDDQVGAAGSAMTLGGSGGGGNMVGGGAGRGGSGNVGGSPPVGGAGGGPPSGGFCNAPETVLIPKCGSAGCHGTGAPNGDFGASDASARAALNVESVYGPDCGLLIDGANPAESAIFTKTQDDFNTQCGSLQMPATGDFLNAVESDCLLDWLSQF